MFRPLVHVSQCLESLSSVCVNEAAIQLHAIASLMRYFLLLRIGEWSLFLTKDLSMSPVVAYYISRNIGRAAQLANTEALKLSSLWRLSSLIWTPLLPGRLYTYRRNQTRPFSPARLCWSGRPATAGWDRPPRCCLTSQMTAAGRRPQAGGSAFQGSLRDASETLHFLKLRVRARSTSGQKYGIFAFWPSRQFNEQLSARNQPKLPWYT